MRLPASLMRSSASWSGLPETVQRHGAQGPALALLTSGHSEKGADKETNQDHIAIAPIWSKTGRSGTLLVLADGLGGHRGGEVASRIIAERLPALLEKRNGTNILTDLVESIIEVHEIIQQESRHTQSLQGMCSTAVVALIIHRILYLVHVGDSRGYLFRNGKLVFRTRDHSLRESPARKGGHSARRLDHVLTQSIGVGSPLVPGIAIYELEPGDRVVLCSDGISDVIAEEEMCTLVAQEDPEIASRHLLECAAAKGGTDDKSVVVVSASEQENE
jgi:serine/threonine protein phosphatase PrpC